MKQWICALLALVLLLSCSALAQETPAATEEAPAAETASPEPDAADADAQGRYVAPPEVGSITVGFEDGFSLELPADWLHYDISDEMAEKGVLYCMSDADGQRWLYIQSWTTDCADIAALEELICSTSNPQTSDVYNLNGTDFIVYDLSEGDVSCCAALLGNQVLNFVFTPQSDANFMFTVTQIISTFTVL